MSVEVIELSRNIMMVIVSGQLTQPELAAAQTQVAEAMAKMDHVRIVVITEDFAGWRQGGDWADLSFQIENDAKIERMALVGDMRWKQQALAFVGQGFRRFPIAYYEHGRLAQARAWVVGA